jgi:hypothetical protein
VEPDDFSRTVIDAKQWIFCVVDEKHGSDVIVDVTSLVDLRQSTNHKTVILMETMLIMVVI